jgi:hypothetical protein
MMVKQVLWNDMLDYFGGWKGKRKGVEREGRVEGVLKGREREDD